MSQPDHHHNHNGSFAPQPSARYCFVCGVENPLGLKVRFDDNGVDTVQARYTVDEMYQSYPGVVHGGVVAALLDEAAGRTTMIAAPNRFMFTGKLTIKYRQPIPVETELLLVGTLLKSRSRTAQAHSEIRLPDGTIAAEADVTMVGAPDGALLDDVDFDALGWMVYPDEPVTGDD